MPETPALPPYPPTIPSMLKAAASRHGDGELLVRGEERLTFAALERRSRDLARGLVASGVGKGSHVGVLLPNGPGFAVAFMAAARIGAVVLPMSTLYQARELKWVLRHADLDTLIVAPRYLGHDYLARLEQALPELTSRRGEALYLTEAPHLRRVYVWGDAAPAWSRPAPAALDAAAEASPVTDALIAAMEEAVTPADPAFMIYTSGSTADPKGVVHTHGNSIRHSFQMATVYGLPKAGERVVSSRPFFWIAGLSASLFYALHGGFCLIVPDGPDPATYLELMERERADFVTGSAPVFAAIDKLARAGDRPLSVVQLVTDYAGVVERRGDVPRFVCRRLEALFPAVEAERTRHRMPSIYGMTETTSAYASLPAPERIPEEKIGANGKPAPGAFVRIVDPETREPLPPDQPGELLVGGYSLMAGLYKKERHETFVGELLYPTGDMCSVDEDGWVTFVTRLSEMIKISGANVAPLEVEMLLNAREAIRESAVVGIDKDRRTELVAAVILHEGARIDEEQLITELKSELSSFKVPKRIVVVADAEVPRTATGKIHKPRLREMLSAG
ncbi:MAG TPA: class I adenylate-forming enzyme family protein [Pseudomonadales bacterium]